MPLQFTTNAADLANVLARCKRIPARNGPLSHVLLTSTASGVTVTATNHDTTFRGYLPATVEVHGSACVAAKEMLAAAKSIAGAVRFNADADSEIAHLTAEHAALTLPAMPPNDFPELPEACPAAAAWHTLDAAILRELLHRAAFAMSTDETRMNLNGIHLEIEPHESWAQITCTATDGHRLAQISRTVDNAGITWESVDTILHKDGVLAYLKAFKPRGATVEIGITRTAIYIHEGGATLEIRTIEDKYPDVSRVIPTSTPHTVAVDRKQLIQAIKQIKGAKPSGGALWRIHLQPCAGGTLAIRANGGRVEIPASHDGVDTSIAVQVPYFVAAVGSFGADRIVLGSSDSCGPVLITAADAYDDALCLVMPVRD